MLNLPASRNEIQMDDRIVRAEAYPISVDFGSLDQLVREPHIMTRAKEIRAELGNPEHVLLGVDRLDYTKGIGQRLKAYGELLAEGRIEPGEAVFVQIATPTRERVEEYIRLRNDIELQVGRMNGEYGLFGWSPINYMHQSYNRDELAALYCAADVMVVTPLRDGMNLVAKEYVACRHDLRGALVLERVRRRGRRAQARLPGQPLRHRRHEARHDDRHARAAPRTGPPHALRCGAGSPPTTWTAGPATS